MVLTDYAKQRILVHFNNGYKAPTIYKLCIQEGIFVSRVNIWRFLCSYVETGSIKRKEGSGRLSKITREVKAIVEEEMQKDDETTAIQLHKLLMERGTYTKLHIVLLDLITKIT